MVDTHGRVAWHTATVSIWTLAARATVAGADVGTIGAKAIVTGARIAAM